jgi:hypothetical protein
MALPGNEKNKLKHQSTVNNQNTEEDLEILLRIRWIITHLQVRLLLYTCVIKQCMSGQPLSSYECAVQQCFVLFGELHIQLETAGLTHTYRDILRFCEL